jgi:putative protease
MLHFDVLRDDGTEEGFTLRVTDTTNTLNGSFTFHLSHQLARTSQRENIIRELSKLGGTPFTCTTFNIAADFPYFIPNSRLAEMRRTMVTHLLKSGTTSNAPFTIQHEAARIPAPSYQQHYLYNIANQQAAAFYHETEPTAYELKGGKAALLMQCRHCLRYSLGYCTRRGGKKPSWHEPLSLQLSNGRKFLLEFDCKNCQMNIYAKQP